jgi:hypothetical protein
MTVYLAQVDLANPAARLAHVVEPQTSGCDRRTDSRMEISWAKNERGANYPVVMAPPSQELEPPINPGRFTALSAIRLPSLEGSPGLRRGQPHSNCLVVHYQNEQPNYQQRKENNDDDRNNGVPASDRLAIGRFGSSFLRRSDTQQEAHLIPGRLNLYAFAYAFAIANSIPARCRRHRFGRVYGSRRTPFLLKCMLPTTTGSGSAPGAGG